MHLCYFDENKYSVERPYFYIGGLIISDQQAVEIDKIFSEVAVNFFGSRSLIKQHEFHGKELFHGKGNSKGRALKERINIFKVISEYIENYKIPVRIVCIDVVKHRKKYVRPIPEYQLGLMLLLEQFCEYLQEIDDVGLVFGDYEADEVTRAVDAFSEYKANGRTKMAFGRSLDRLIDTVYFTQSHHSRFLQVADLIIYMAGRFDNQQDEPDRWHEKQVWNCWDAIRKLPAVSIKKWSP